MNPDAAAKPRVHTRRGFINVATTDRHEPHRKLAQLDLVKVDTGCPLKAATPIDPRSVAPVHEDIRDAGVGDERGKRAELVWVAAILGPADG